MKTATQSAIQNTMASMAAGDSATWYAIRYRGQIRAAKVAAGSVQVWVTRRWHSLASLSADAVEIDCPWYADPAEATRRANGVAPVRYANEIVD